MKFCLFIILVHFFKASFVVRKSLSPSVEEIISQISETTAAVVEPDATIVREYIYYETNTEKKTWTFYKYVTLP